VTVDDDSPDGIVSADEVIEAYGHRFYQAALGHGFHLDLRGRPCWVREEWDRVRALVEYDMKRKGGEPDGSPVVF
jgi:hypothetical protein